MPPTHKRRRIDMSPEAIARRIAEVAALNRLCASLSQARRIFTPEEVVLAANALTLWGTREGRERIAGLGPADLEDLKQRAVSAVAEVGVARTR